MTQKQLICSFIICVTSPPIGQIFSATKLHGIFGRLNADTTHKIAKQWQPVNCTVIKDSCLCDSNVKEQLAGSWYSNSYSGSTTLFKTPPKNWVRKFEIDEGFNITTIYNKLPEGTHKDYLPDGNGKLECDNKTGDVYFVLQNSKYKLPCAYVQMGEPLPIYLVNVPSVKMELICDKSEYKIGEEIKIECWIYNQSDSLFYIQNKRKFRLSHRTLSVTVPGDSQFVFEPDMYKKVAPITAEDYSPLAPEDKLKLFDLKGIIAGDAYEQGYWVPVSANEKSTVPFKSIGQYVISFKYMDMLPEKDKGFKGAIVSETRIVILE